MCVAVCFAKFFLIPRYGLYFVVLLLAHSMLWHDRMGIHSVERSDISRFGARCVWYCGKGWSVPYHYSSCCSCWGTSSKKSKALSFQMRSGWNLVECSSTRHASIESDCRFDVTLSWWGPWRHFTQKNAATCWVLHRICQALCSSASLRQFLICSTSVLVML